MAFPGGVVARSLLTVGGVLVLVGIILLAGVMPGYAERDSAAMGRIIGALVLLLAGGGLMLYGWLLRPRPAAR